MCYNEQSDECWCLDGKEEENEEEEEERENTKLGI